MPQYLVESYEPRPDGRRHAALSDAPGYVRTVHVPDDETTFHLFENTTLEELRAALAEARLPYDRIVEAT